jgi:hypothetical protein
MDKIITDMSYKVSEYTKQQAKRLGVIVLPSMQKGKKIDVYSKDCILIASVGAQGYKDYPTYKELERKGIVPQGTAEIKRKAYKARHIFRNKKCTPAYFADKLLW